MIKGIEHIGIRVSNMERSLTFYENVLGLTCRKRTQMDENVELAFLHLPNQPQTEIELSDRPIVPAEGLVNHLAFNVEDIEAEFNRMKDLGVQFADDFPSMSKVIGRRNIFFTGPDGEKFELIEE